MVEAVHAGCLRLAFFLATYEPAGKQLYLIVEADAQP
jgi:hypothetical protein